VDLVIGVKDDGIDSGYSLCSYHLLLRSMQRTSIKRCAYGQRVREVEYA